MLQKPYFFWAFVTGNWFYSAVSYFICAIVKDTSITKQRKFYTILLSGFRIILFFQYEHLEVSFIVNCISFEARGPCREKFNVLFYTRTCNYIFCKMYINSCHFHKSSHWLSSTPMRNNPREMQMTTSDIFSVNSTKTCLYEFKQL